MTGRISAGTGAWGSERTVAAWESGERTLPNVWGDRRADILGLFAILTVTSLAALQSLAGGTLIGQDAATQHFPWYAYLGSQLRALEIPGWNPFQFAGAPCA